MGDLVGSERDPDISTLHARFNAAIERQNEVFGERLASPLTITLGDEFQGLASSLTTAAEIARELRFDLMNDAIDCRFAIGLADIQTPINRQRAWNMMGPGLASTRERLNEKRSDTFYRFDMPGHPALEGLLEASGASLTAIERRWTDTQRLDIQALLRGSAPVEIARRRNVSVHTIYKVRSSGDFDLYLLHWNAILKALAELDGTFSQEV